MTLSISQKDDEANNFDFIKYWENKALENVSWIKQWEEALHGDFSTLDINWFIGGQLNVCYNCIDRHLATSANKKAIIWEGNEVANYRELTYKQLHTEVCKFANVLKAQGIKKGDRICIYLPMIPEVIIAMLACVRIGAIHSVVFAGFSADALKTRILDADCNLVITADGNFRGEKLISLKDNVDKALQLCPNVQQVIIVKHANLEINWVDDRDIWYHESMLDASSISSPEPMQATDPLFILYTSGSTGSPKGVLHTCGGYLVYVATTFKQVFDYKNSDIYWCTADVGWITGHSYLVYGPLANSATTLMYEGVPNYPNFSRYWKIIDKYKVTQFYTSPTALRSLRKEGDEYLESTNRNSLRVLGVVGEPLNPEVWEWFYEAVGHKKCPIINTWWQTETGGIILSPTLTSGVKSGGSVGFPIAGTTLDIVDDNGVSVLNKHLVGKLIIKHPWPGLMQSIYGNHKRFVETYFSEVPGYYYSGDGAYQDKNGNFWITGRSDDVIKVSGHRIGTEEIESSFLLHQDVAEAAVVGISHPIKGEAIFAFVALKTHADPTPELKNILIQTIRHKVGPFAAPENIQWVDSLPKTRSGKIMRRILRKIANNDIDNIGDISTLADPSVVEKIIKETHGY